MGLRRPDRGILSTPAESVARYKNVALRLKQFAVQLTCQGDGVFVGHAGDEIHGFA